MKRAAAGVAAALLAVAFAGCGKHVMRPAPSQAEPPYAATSAENALRLLEWGYNQKAVAPVRALFSGDYRFVFSPQDSAGAEYRAVPWTRAEELNSNQHLFVGGGPESPASTITLTFDKSPFVQPDTLLAPWDVAGRWHQVITTQLLLNIRTMDGNAIDISGAATFYFVRGDSASIPADLGVGPDSTRWYIRRWDDFTVQPAAPMTRAFRAQPVSSKTWGQIKVLYLN